MIFQNYVNIEGYITAKPEVKETKCGIKYCRFTVCYDEFYKDNTTDEWKSIPNFINCMAWKKTAEITGLMEKGTPVSVIGKLKYSQWTDNNKKKSSLTVVARAVRKFEKLVKVEEIEPPLEDVVIEQDLDEYTQEAFELFEHESDTVNV